MIASSLENKIRGLIAPSLETMGYTLVLLRVNDGNNRRVLQIMAERKDEVLMGFDDCEAISNTVSALMDVEDPISGAYSLEVSSPGLDRPLTALEDFTRFNGYEAKIEVMIPVEGRKRFRGPITAKGEEISITVDGVSYAIVFSNIRTAKLVVTDALVAEAMKKAKQKESSN